MQGRVQSSSVAAVLCSAVHSAACGVEAEMVVISPVKFFACAPPVSRWISSSVQFSGSFQQRDTGG